MRRLALVFLCALPALALTGLALPTTNNREGNPHGIHRLYYHPSYHLRPAHLRPAHNGKARRVERVTPLPPPPPPPSTTTTTTAPPPPSDTGWKALTLSLSWDGSLMIRIAFCESGWNPLAENPYSSAFGLFQQLGETSTDPITQTYDAYHLWQDQGYGAWSASSSCWG